MRGSLLHNVEAERATLGAIMITSGKCLPEVQDVIVTEDFFAENHQLIYDAICALDSADRPTDHVTVLDYLSRRGHIALEKTVADIVSEAISAANVRAYAKVVREHSIRREMVRAASQIQALANEPGEIDELLSRAQDVILAAGKERAQKGPEPIEYYLPKWIDAIDSRSSSEYEVSGIPTGFTDLDRKINGLQRGNLIVIAGRPSMGKTALATNFLNFISTYRGLPGLLFSMEMSSDEVLTRVVSQTGKVPVDRLMSGNLDDEHWSKINDTIDRVKHSKIVLDDSAALLLQQIRARARRVQQQHGKLGIIVVDYLQLMSAEGRYGETRAQQISEMTRGLKALAKDLDVPVVVLSQLNRDVEKRENKRPRLSDLKESGSIEQDADVILFIYRDVVYNESTKHKKVAEIIVGKQRNGPTGTVLLYYFGEYTMFGQMETEAQQAFWHDQHSSNKRGRDDSFDPGDY